MLDRIRLHRRSLLRAAAALAGGGLLPAAASSTPRELRLRAAPASARLIPGSERETAVWAYGGEVPGPVLRFRQGERVRIHFTNDLPQPTTVHWHGLRVPNGMDGVPGISQAPVPPGGAFVYEFDLEDAGTYWYHPHFRSAEQQDRGLHGALVVEERDPPPVDRDLVWLLDDWRLDREAAIVDDFDNRHDASHAGRLGNTATLRRPSRCARASACGCGWSTPPTPGSTRCASLVTRRRSWRSTATR